MTATLALRYTLGLDLGKLADYTALAVAEERAEGTRPHPDPQRFGVVPAWSKDPDYALPWLERWPLQTPYHTIAEEVARRVADLAGRPGVEVALFADATGVGTAVIEMLAAQPAIRALKRRFAPVTITAGHETTRGWDRWHPWYHVPKKELVGSAQVALQRHKLKVAASLPEAATLTNELRTFEVKITESAHATYAHRDGAHDDLVLATALALWGAAHTPTAPTVTVITDFAAQVRRGGRL